MYTKRRTRVSKGQSRFGCFTCKVRRVKCDEEKPSCQRCLRAKIRCRGYADGASEGGSLQIASICNAEGTVSTLSHSGRIRDQFISPFITRDASPTTSWALGLDQHQGQLVRNALHLMSSSHVDDFEFVRSIVNDLLFKCAYLCASTKAAAVALGAAVEQQFKTQSSSPVAKRHVAGYYGRAVKVLCRDLCSHDHSQVNILLSAMLLACTELVLRRRAHALVHVHGMHSSTMMAPPSDVDNTSGDLDLLFRNFDLLNIACSDSTRRPDMTPLSPRATICELNPMKNMLALDRHIIETVHSSYSFMANTAIDLCRCRYQPSLSIEQGRHIASMKQCLALTTDMLQQYGGSSLQPHILRLHNICLWVLIELSMYESKTEVEWDVYAGDFEQIITGAEQIISTRRQKTHPNVGKGQPALSIQLGLVQPLLMAATRYRHPVWRRRAIDCLRLTGREGPWLGSLAAAIAERVMQLEEPDTMVKCFAMSTKTSNESTQRAAPLVSTYTEQDVPEKDRISIFRCIEDLSESCGSPVNSELSIGASTTMVRFLRRRRPVSAVMARTLSSGRLEDIIRLEKLSITELNSADWEEWVEIVPF